MTKSVGLRVVHIGSGEVLGCLVEIKWSTNVTGIENGRDIHRVCHFFPRRSSAICDVWKVMSKNLGFVWYLDLDQEAVILMSALIHFEQQGIWAL